MKKFAFKNTFLVSQDINNFNILKIIKYWSNVALCVQINYATTRKNSANFEKLIVAMGWGDLWK